MVRILKGVDTSERATHNGVGELVVAAGATAIATSSLVRGVDKLRSGNKIPAGLYLASAAVSGVLAAGATWAARSEGRHVPVQDWATDPEFMQSPQEAAVDHVTDPITPPDDL